MIVVDAVVIVVNINGFQFVDTAVQTYKERAHGGHEESRMGTSGGSGQ